MVKGKKMFTWIVCVFFVLIFSGLIVQDLSAKTMSAVTFGGWWTEGHRSASGVVPISAVINGDILSIQSSSVPILLYEYRKMALFFMKREFRLQKQNIL